MQNKNRTPSFNIKVVVQETGLKPDTLRAWERRYGMPEPRRSSGGHRLYSQYEIDMLTWLVARQEEGLSISHAIDLWRKLEEEGREPLHAQPLENATEESYSPPVFEGESIKKLRDDWIAACLAFDEYQAQQLLAEAFALFTVETVCFEVLQKGLAQIGQGWYTGDVSVQQEHFASALAVRQLEALIAALSTAVRRERVLVACPAHEQHTFSPLIVTLLLRRRGWDVVYLGANVPTERLAATVQSIQPQLVILTAQTLHTAGSLLDAANILHAVAVPLAYGGAIFNHIPAARQAIPGHFLGETLPSVPQAAKNLLETQPAPVEFTTASPALRAAHDLFVAQRPRIEADLHNRFAYVDLESDALTRANADLGNNIVAALKLGSMELMDANLAWVQGLLINFHYRMPQEAMEAYMQAYLKALEQHLDARAQPIIAWFHTVLNQPA